MSRLLLAVLLAVFPLAACKREPAAPAVAAPATPPNPEADLKVLNEAVRAHLMGQMKDPATLEELVQAGFLKHVPAAPDGKKYVLSPDRKSAQLVNR